MISSLSTCPVMFLQGGERYKFPNSNPFVEEDMDKNEVASVAYRLELTPIGLF